MSPSWMSPALLWALFLVLLALMLVASLRFDWLKVWWQDQWSQLRQLPSMPSMSSLRPGEPSGAGDTSAVLDAVSLPVSTRSPEPRLRRRAEPPAPAPRFIQAARAPAHRTSGLWTHTLTPHAGVHRSLFHRSGRRH